jgi:hypothetical protein
LAEQVRRALSRIRDPATLLLYVQSGTGTHAAPAVLRALYDTALAQASFRELIVATRPDCVDVPRARLLGSYRVDDREVWVELGLQSSNERTLDLLRRGHDYVEFSRAFAMLRDSGVRVAVHLIFGLPGEDQADILRTVQRVAALEPDGIKIHNLHILRATALGTLFLHGEVTAPSLSSHARLLARALELLPPRTVVIRLVTDSLERERLAPPGAQDKSAFLRELHGLMLGEGRYQGRLFP